MKSLFKLIVVSLIDYSCTPCADYMFSAPFLLQTYFYFNEGENDVKYLYLIILLIDY